MEFLLTDNEEKIFKILLEVVRIKSPDTILRMAGGVIRDRLLNIDSSDIDIAVSNMSGLDFANLVVEYLEENDMATRMPTVIKANPSQSKHLETAMLEINGLSIDFVNLRKETYADSRIPTIEFGTIQEDALRRDLTINALYYNLHTKEIEDYINGLHDLEYSIAKTPIDPIKTFIDDPLRIYRCIRFATKYKLNVDENIIWATREFKVVESLKTKVSADRIFKEIGGSCQANGEWKNGCFSISLDSSAEALELLEKMDLLYLLFEDCFINFHKAYYYLINTFGFGSSQDILVSTLVIILRDNPESQIKDSLLKIKCPVNIITRINRLINAIKYLRLHCDSDKNIRKFLRMANEDYRLAAYIAEVDFMGDSSFEKEDIGIYDKIHKFVDEQGGPKIKPPISGKDLLENGYSPGPEIGKYLTLLDEQLLENPNITKEEALKWLEEVISATNA